MTKSLKDLAVKKNIYIGAAVNTNLLTKDPEYNNVLKSEFNMVAGLGIVGVLFVGLITSDWNPDNQRIWMEIQFPLMAALIAFIGIKSIIDISKWKKLMNQVIG